MSGKTDRLGPFIVWELKFERVRGTAGPGRNEPPVIGCEARTLGCDSHPALCDPFSYFGATGRIVARIIFFLAGAIKKNGKHFPLSFVLITK